MNQRTPGIYLNAAAALLFEKDVLGLQVAVDDSVAAQGLQALQDGVCKLPDQRQAETLELIALDELIQVHAQQLKSHADVVPEGEVFQHVNHIHCAVAVLLVQMLQDADFLLRLSVETLLVAHHLQRQVLLKLVVVHFSHLAKAALTNNLKTAKQRLKSEAIFIKTNETAFK